MPLLSLQAVHFAYPSQGREVLAGVDLQIDRGEVVVVVGPNGAGKTTLLRVVSGLLAPTSGSVLLDGEAIHAMPRRIAARRIAGAWSENDPLFPFTVRETVELGRHAWRSPFGRLSEADEARVGAALDAVQLADMADRALPALSSGERQRAAIARCLAQEGDLVLLDEPTAHLDLGHRLRVLDVFGQRAARREQGVLAALHDLNLAARTADRILLLADGRFVAQGAPIDVLTRERIERYFGAEVEILTHPRSGRPVVVPAEATPPEEAP